MKPGIVVFLGPSLPVREAEGILEACYLPPAKRGDIPGAVRDGARVICLIDGVFFQDCSVGHREILSAISSGVRVLGASSMGALRASELDTLGMEGVGEVYRMYRDGVVVSDDEVALVFDPESGIALSLPLVNIRHVLVLALHQHIIGEKDHQEFLSAARQLYFPDRTWERIRDKVAGKVETGVTDRLLEFASSAPDLKREDAIEALTRTRKIAEESGLLCDDK